VLIALAAICGRCWRRSIPQDQHGLPAEADRLSQLSVLGTDELGRDMLSRLIYAAACRC